MRIYRNIALGAALCMFAMAPALAAQTVETAPSDAYDAVMAKLISEGYHDIRIVDPEAGKVCAFDENGSEVVLVVEESTRRILSETCVHPGDN